ncbi:MAG: MmgE/PrpD family protein [Pseudomonadota bacterium]
MSLIELLREASWCDLPPSVQQMSKRCLLDLVGVAAAGATTPLSSIIRDHASKHFGAGGTSARMLFDGRAVSPAGAALAGGMTIDAIDAHDGYPGVKGHAGCGLLPALLAIAEDRNPSGAEFLTVLALGYEVSIRAGLNLHRTVADYHTSGAWVAVGIAAVAGRLLGLTQQQTRHAMGIAEYHGPRSQMMRCIDHPTMLKDGSGWGAMAGTSAAYLAEDGFTGAPAITVEGAEEFSDLGHRWMILEQYFKPYPVCRWAQPPVECARQLRRDNDFSAADITAIRTHTFHEAARLSTPAPKDTEQAQYSLPFAVAAFLVRGTIGAAEVGEDGLNDPEIARLSHLFTPVEDQRFNAVFPEERWARLEIDLANGRTLTSEDHVAHGNAENPLSDEEIDAKFEVFMSGAGMAARAGRINAVIDVLDTADDLAELMDMITAPA